MPGGTRFPRQSDHKSGDMFYSCDSPTCDFTKMEQALRNVILISLDTLRASSMSCYGHKNLTTPHLDQLAAQSTLFETCLSPHIPTHPGHTTMFTGKDVLTHQIITQGGTLNLGLGVKTIAELLTEARISSGDLAHLKGFGFCCVVR